MSTIAQKHSRSQIPLYPLKFELFLLKDIATVIEGVNYADYEDKIKEAAESCPVEVIKYSE